MLKDTHLVWTSCCSFTVKAWVSCLILRWQSDTQASAGSDESLITDLSEPVHWQHARQTTVFSDCDGVHIRIRRTVLTSCCPPSLCLYIVLNVIQRHFSPYNRSLPAGWSDPLTVVVMCKGSAGLWREMSCVEKVPQISVALEWLTSCLS